MALPQTTSAPVAEVLDLRRRFGRLEALRGVSLAMRAGEIHALLGRNGAGKTTLLRILAGLTEPSGGVHRLLDRPVVDPRSLAGRVGFVPAGDRTLYLRISGLENLVFFARLHGMRKKAAVARATAALEQVGLSPAGHRRVAEYSHGMQKRLSVARALLTAPPLLLVDEATHDLDPEGAEVVRRLISSLAMDGAAVLWATQRVDEIRGFADGVTFLDAGQARYQGSIAGLLAHARTNRYVVRVRNGDPASRPAIGRLRTVLEGRAEVSELTADAAHVVVAPAPGVPLGEAIAVLADAGFDVLSCRHERSEVEEAFLALAGAGPNG